MNPRHDRARPGATHADHRPRETTSDQLLGEARQLYIRHRGEWYTLRQTANDKLILTK